MGYNWRPSFSVMALMTGLLPAPTGTGTTGVPPGYRQSIPENAVPPRRARAPISTPGVDWQTVEYVPVTAHWSS